jgi:hypothetical protein
MIDFPGQPFPGGGTRQAPFERDLLAVGDDVAVALARSVLFTLATQDGVLREALLAALGPVPVEQLLGVRPDVLDGLVSRGVPVRVYVPFGRNWFRYSMRRVAESRGAG